MLGNASTLAVELVVLGTRKLLGALGAVVALAGAEGGRSALGAQSHARGRTGEDALGEHGGRRCGRVEMGGSIGGWVVDVEGCCFELAR